MKACVIGVGNMGRHHIRIYSENNRVDLVGICDRDQKLGAYYSDKYETRYYENYVEMIKQEKPDILSLATPTSTHNQIGKEVLNHGIHLLVEKPISDTINNAMDLINTAEKKNLVLLVGHLERYNQGVRKLKNLIDDNHFGRITSMQFQRVGIIPPQIKDTNVVIDLAIHDIDLSNYIIGSPPDTVTAHLNNTLLKNRFDSCDILMSYNNTSSYLQANWITPVKIRNISVTGEKGYAKLNLITQKIEIYESIIEAQIDDYGDYIVKFQEPKFSVEKSNGSEPLALEIENFINTVEKKEKLIVKAEDAVTALSIAIDIHNKNK